MRWDCVIGMWKRNVAEERGRAGVLRVGMRLTGKAGSAEAA